jgi:hypothetical protein
VAAWQAKAILCEHNELNERFMGHQVVYTRIKRDSTEMTAIIEDTARTLGGKVWEYWLSDLSDLAYKRLVNQIWRMA